MKCFEVTVNNQDPVVVGDASAALVQGSLFLATKGKGGVVFSSYVESEPNKAENREWIGAVLDVGDEIRIRLVDSEFPDPPQSSSLHGEAVEPSSHLLACSMCRRKRNQVKRLLAAGNVSICDECVARCVESLGQNPPGESGEL